jgi:hypothetical protein
MATSDGIRHRIEEFTRQLCEELGEVDAGEGDCWLDALENRAIEVGDAVSAALLARQASEQPVQEESSCPQCGQTGRYTGDRQRELISRRGPVTITEPAYFCPCCRKAFFPDDAHDRR